LTIFRITLHFFLWVGVKLGVSHTVITH
jgi:hypothetical protein